MASSGHLLRSVLLLLLLLATTPTTTATNWKSMLYGETEAKYYAARGIMNSLIEMYNLKNGPLFTLAIPQMVDVFSRVADDGITTEYMVDIAAFLIIRGEIWWLAPKIRLFSQKSRYENSLENIRVVTMKLSKKVGPG
ncbi:hypothetical protein AXF42_Ash001415 [Apostasia shenzhenica]|uniref:Uncharacterized protein n=1 Tax=Apostasia shenzhenica TaxID=1088818 RepID=A0A2I0AUV1_9ASPA|nr:hypothetical protein AXF42_Ash001415 [Apostasia shenzhenica]